MHDHRGPIIAEGRSATIHDIGDGRVLRRYRDTGRSAQPEADVLILAAGHGIPVPAVHDAQGPDLVLQRIDGPSMLDQLTRRPWTFQRNAVILAQLHDRLHAVPAPQWLRRPFDTPEDAVLCHFDLHPGNVILSINGPVLIDWEAAAAGTAPLDHAQTHLLITTSTPPGGAAAAAIARIGNRLFAARIRAAVTQPCTADELGAVATARLADPHLLPEEANRVHTLIGRLPGQQR
ncbi:MAG: phosphotransferase [Actinomycetota bacterium]|nr:phosphotransferase [Actinomycetota bacterium]